MRNVAAGHVEAVVADTRHATPALGAGVHRHVFADAVPGADLEPGALAAVLQILRHRPEAYVSAGKRTKQIWLLVTGVAVLLGFLTLGNPLNLFALLGVVGAAVYLADVRPAVSSAGGRGRRTRDTW